MNLYGFTLRGLGKSILGWCVGLCALLMLYLALYPMFRAMGFDVGALLAQFPDSLQALFGMSGLDTNRFSGFLPFPLKLGIEMAAIGGLVLGAHAAARDHREHCADFLFSKPVSRTGVLVAKTAAVATAAAVLLAVLVAFLLGAARLLAPRETFTTGQALGAAAVPVLIFALYGAAGLLLGTALPGVRGVGGIGVASMFFFHLVMSVGKVAAGSPDHPVVRALVPVSMFDRALAAGQGLLETPYLVLWGLEVAALLAAALAVQRRRGVE